VRGDRARRPGRALVRDALIAGLLIVIALAVAVVRHRNLTVRARQLAAASAAIEAIGGGGWPGAGEVAIAGVVKPAVADPEYPFLHQRRVVQQGSERTMGGPSARALDKLLFDAAGRALAAGPELLILPDGTGRAVASSLAGADVIVAVTRPPAPPPALPWAIILGALAAAIALLVAGARLGHPAVGLGGALAIGAAGGLAWGGPLLAAALAAIAIATAALHARGTTGRWADGIARHRIALGFLAPAAIAMVVLVAVPFTVGLVLGFYDHHHGTWTFVGVDNFAHILGGGGRPITDPLNFWFILAVTLAWTFANVVLHVSIGTALALALRQPWLRGKGLFRVLLIVPWAIPNYITALIWKGMFAGQYGAINSLFREVGLGGVSWFESWATAFTANVVTNTWLGFPFMMVVALGALESIPRDLYEAAEVDGASTWQRFTQITLPHLRPALGPAVVLGAIWTFNMFNVIFLVSGGRPGGSTDILVTDAYRWAFERGERYGMAAAMGAIIFLILLAWTLLGARVGKKEAT
jgi:ABC-type sugar transport system permease subunit